MSAITVHRSWWWMAPYGNREDVDALLDFIGRTTTVRRVCDLPIVADGVLWYFARNRDAWALDVSGVCLPALVYRNQNHAYYWRATALRLMARALPPRPRCEACHHRRPDRAHVNGMAGAWEAWRDFRFCSPACRLRGERRARRAERKRQQEERWLRENQKSLRTVRQWLRDRRPGASGSPRAGSKPVPISPT